MYLASSSTAVPWGGEPAYAWMTLPNFAKAAEERGLQGMRCLKDSWTPLAVPFAIAADSADLALLPVYCGINALARGASLGPMKRVVIESWSPSALCERTLSN